MTPHCASSDNPRRVRYSSAMEDDKIGDGTLSLVDHQETEDREVDKYTIDALRASLKRAEDGEFVGIVIIAECRDGSMNTTRA